MVLETSWDLLNQAKIKAKSNQNQIESKSNQNHDRILIEILGNPNKRIGNPREYINPRSYINPRTSFVPRTSLAPGLPGATEGAHSLGHAIAAPRPQRQRAALLPAPRESLRRFVGEGFPGIS